MQDIYREVKTNIRTFGGATKDLPITIALHQGLALSPFLFGVVLDEITWSIKGDMSWCMLFADDIFLVDETKEEVNVKLERWRHEFESWGIKLSKVRHSTWHKQDTWREINHSKWMFQNLWLHISRIMETFNKMWPI